MNLILASTSPYRARVLRSLGLPFIQMDADYAEVAEDFEHPTELCIRFARGKARAAASQGPAAPYLIIGSDQVAYLADGTLLRKPGGFDAAFEQLQVCSGRWVTFETAVSLLTDDGIELTQTESIKVRYRELSEADIIRYLNIDRPYDSAGSIKAEGPGIALIAEMRGRDFNTMMGLPLMLLVDMLETLKIDVLNEIK